VANSGFNLTGNIDINAGGAVRAATTLANRMKSLSENSRSSSKTLKDTATAMDRAASAANKERKSLADLVKAQEAANKTRRESIALANKTKAQTDAIRQKSSDDSGLAFNKKQIALGESMAKITREETLLEERLNTERERGVQIAGRTKNEADTAAGRVALTNARALTEAVRQRIALEQSENQIVNRNARTVIAQQRLQLSQQRALTAAQKEGQLSVTGVRYGMFQASATAGILGASILGAARSYAQLIIAGNTAVTSVVRTNDVFRQSADGVNEARKQFGALSQELPLTFEQLTEIGTLGGQLGIQGAQLGNFTRAVAEFSSITNVSVEDTATAFGRLNSVVPSINGNFQGLADSIAKVGVNSVATESEIIKITTQISSVAAQAGYSADQIVGLSGAMASIGAPAELSRGVVTRTFGQISRAVSAGGAELEKWASASGMTADQFKENWGNDASGTFVQFMTKLNESGAGGEATLRGLGITSVRDVPLLLRLAGAADSAGKTLSSTDKRAGLLNQTLRDAAHPANEVAKQFELINSSVGAKLQLLLNSIGVALREIGATNLGPLGTIIGTLTRQVNNFSQSLDKPVKLLGMIDLPFTNGEMLGWVAVGAAIVGALSLIVAGLAAVSASLLLVDQLGSRVFGKSLLGGITGYITGASRAEAATARLGATATQASSGMTILGTSTSKMGNSTERAIKSFNKFGGAPTIMSRIGATAGKASEGVSKLGGKLGGLAKAFGPELIVAGLVGIVTAASAVNEAIRNAGSSTSEMAAALKTANSQAKLLSQIRTATPIGFMGAGGMDIKPFVRDTKELNTVLKGLGPGGAWNDFVKITFGGGGLGTKSDKTFGQITAGLDKVQNGFNTLVDNGDMDDAVRGIQLFFKGASREAVDNSLGHMGDVSASLAQRLQAMNLKVNPENMYKLATGAIGATKAQQDLAGAVKDSTAAFEGSSDAAGDFIDSVNSTYSGMVDFNAQYTKVLDTVNEKAKQKWVAAGNNVADFKEVATANLSDFYATLDKQFATANAFQGNVATIMNTIGTEYGKQLETLPAKLVASVAKGGPDAARELAGYLDKVNAGPIIAANMAKAAGNPKIYEAYQAAGGKGAEAFNKALTNGMDITDTIAQMKKELDVATGTAQVKIKIHGDTAPVKKDGETAAEYLNRLEAFIKAKGDMTIARSDFANFTEYANGINAYIKARGDTAPARADFQSAADYVNAMTAYITLHGDKVPAQADGESAKAYMDRLQATIQIRADGAPARKEGEDSAAYTNRLKATITILGDKFPAQKKGEDAEAYINRLKGIIEVDANNGPAKGKAHDAKHYTDAQRGIMKIDGNNATAKQKAAQAKANADKTKGTMKIDGNNNSAKEKAAAAKAYADSRTATIKVGANLAGAFSAIGDFISHGWQAVVNVVTHQKKAGGGPVYGPGSGTSDSIPAMLSNGEYVIRAAQARKYRSLLDQINYGARGYATGGQVTAGAARYDSTSAAVQTSATRERGSSIYQITELSAYDRHLLQTIADNIGVVIAPEHIAGATTTTYRAQSRRGNG